jgi:hypothetical protein
MTKNSIDKYGYCCLSDSYYSEDDEVCLDVSTCKPIFTLDKALVKDNNANNGEFVARLDSAMRYKLASLLATLEKCISATRNILEKVNHYLLESQDNF